MFAAALPTRLHTVDLAIIIAYLAGITLFGLRFRRSDRSLRNYFLAGRTIPWWAIALSIVSAETSTLTIISIPGVAFATDFGFLQLVFGYMIGRIVLCLLFIPKYFEGELFTAYQLIDQRFGPALHKVTAGLFLLTRAAAEGVRVFAISIVIALALGTSNDVMAIGIISLLTLAYTFEGGMAAVIWTDVVQMFIYILGTLVALFTLGSHVTGGWSQIHTVAAAAGKFHIFHSAPLKHFFGTPYTFWAGILGGTFLTMASHGTDQLMVQRLLAAKNLRESRLALLSSGAVILMQFTLFLIIGAGLYVFYSQHPQSFASNDRIFPSFIVQQMPIGVAGLLIAAILAAAMSNLSAALNSLSSTSVVDFYLHLRPAATEQQRTTISRASTIMWAFILFALACYTSLVGGKGHVVETGLSIASVAYGALLGVFLLGTLTRYASQTAAIIGMVTGFALNLTLWIPTLTGNYHLGPITIPHIAFTWYVFIGSIVTFATGSLFSLIFKNKMPSKKSVTTAALILATFSCLSFRSVAEEPASRPHPAQMPVILSEARSAQSKNPRSPSTPAQSQSPAPDFTPLDALIKEALEKKLLPGAVLLIAHQNKVVYKKTYGLRSEEPTVEPMTEDTIFDMASLTKCLATATAIMQLYEQGKFQFDDPVAKYLPDFAQNGKEKVTIRQLLTHYSGLPEDVSLKDPWGLTAPDKPEAVRRAMAATLYGPPGLTFKYSDINFITLGLLVEKFSGQSLDQYVRSFIFLPLQMQNTQYLPINLACGTAQDLPPYSLAAIFGNPHLKQGIADCWGKQWPAMHIIPRTAPTAYDDQGTKETNPNFGVMLRGTVHDPSTRRMGGVAGHAGVFSTAADVSLFAQALLDKLLHNTGPFPLKQSTLQLMTTPQQPPTAQTGATVFQQNGEATKGIATRGFGWDINSAFARPRGEVFPTVTPDGAIIKSVISTGAKRSGETSVLLPSFGHTGFTGTSLWIDPTSNTYVILLANAVHPHGRPPISALRGKIATAAALALGIPPAPPQNPVILSEAKNPRISPAAPPLPSETASRYPDPSGSGPQQPVQKGLQPLGHAVLTGIDVLEKTNFAALSALQQNKHLNIALLTNQAGIDRNKKRTIDILNSAPAPIKLKTLFTPEHGLAAAVDSTTIAPETDPTSHLPVITLYGAKDAQRRPTHDQLKDLDAVVIDLQDAGVHFWTYESVLGYFLEAAAQEDALGHHLNIVVLDRPALTPPIAPRGPLSDPGSESYVNYMPEPLQHGMTYGELAQFINAENVPTKICRSAENVEGSHPEPKAKDLNVQPQPSSRATADSLCHPAPLTVIKMQNYSRALWFDETNLPWINPSPNLRTQNAATVYAGLGLLDSTNVSVGRGATGTPFEHIGAPFIHAKELADYLTARHILGITFTPTTFAVEESPNKYPGHGQTIPGIDLHITDRTAINAPELGIEVVSALHHLYPTEFNLARIKNLLANQQTLDALQADKDPHEIEATWQSAVANFAANRAKYLLYP